MNFLSFFGVGGEHTVPSGTNNFNRSICHIDRTLTNTPNPGQSGLENDGG